MSSARLKPLSQLAGDLHDSGADVSRLRQPQLWQGAVMRRFPAEFIDSRWFYDPAPDNLKVIAEALGLPRRQAEQRSSSSLRKPRTVA
jgi:hypothetical protein